MQHSLDSPTSHEPWAHTADDDKICFWEEQSTIKSKIIVRICDFSTLRLILTSQPQEALRLGTSIMKNLLYVLALGLAIFCGSANSTDSGITPVYKVSPIGWVRKTDNRTIIEVDKQYQPGMLGIDELDTIWVLYWFDRNDTPEQRSILQVHPRRNPENPLRGVFATRAPVRPNLIALSRCRVISVQNNVIEIDYIDAFPDTPVLDIKP